MSVDGMREALKGVYPSVSWRQKVMKMSDKQVMGIYYSMLREGKLVGASHSTTGKGGQSIC